MALLALTSLFHRSFLFKGSARIGKRVPLSAPESLGIYFYILLFLTILLLVFIFLKNKRPFFNYIAVLIASLCFALVIIFSGLSIQNIGLNEEFTRCSMSIGSYLYLTFIFLAKIKCADSISSKGFVIFSTALSMLLISIAFVLGLLDDLSIFVEYKNRKQQFHQELLNHLNMSVKVVLTGILLGIPLGWIAYYKHKTGRIILSILNTLESIPALALICVIMFPLAFLSNRFSVLQSMGISGVGATPVFLALLCYSLFQIVHSVYGALGVIDKKYIEIAQGMGMTKMQIFFQIEIPIIFPIIISGIRVSLVSSILGVTIGAYVGFGGLGMFILQGITGFAIDLVLLVTFPIMFMIFFFDFLLEGSVVLLTKIREYRGRFSL